MSATEITNQAIGQPLARPRKLLPGWIATDKSVINIDTLLSATPEGNSVRLLFKNGESIAACDPELLQKLTDGITIIHQVNSNTPMENETVLHHAAPGAIKPTDDEIEKELQLIESGLLDQSTPPNRYCQLYAAQQAIQWMRDKRTADSPYRVIAEGRVMPVVKPDIQAA